MPPEYKLCFIKSHPFIFLNNSVTHQSIFVGFGVQHPEEVRYKPFNVVYLALKL